jgi:hypothetical protein
MSRFSLFRIVPAASHRAVVRNVAHAFRDLRFFRDLDESRGGIEVLEEPAPPEARKDVRNRKECFVIGSRGRLYVKKAATLGDQRWQARTFSDEANREPFRS